MKKYYICFLIIVAFVSYIRGTCTERTIIPCVPVDVAIPIETEKKIFYRVSSTGEFISNDSLEVSFLKDSKTIQYIAPPYNEKTLCFETEATDSGFVFTWSDKGEYFGINEYRDNKYDGTAYSWTDAIITLTNYKNGKKNGILKELYINNNSGTFYRNNDNGYAYNEEWYYNDKKVCKEDYENNIIDKAKGKYDK